MVGMILFGVLVSIQLLQISFSKTVGAEIAWGVGTPTVISARSTSEWPAPICQYKFQTTVTYRLAGTLENQTMCATVGDQLTFGTHKNRRAGVAFRNDSQMYAITNLVCDVYPSCVYLPKSDTLVTREQIGGFYAPKLVIYKHFISRLSRTFNPDNLSNEYTFNTDNPDFIFQESNGTLRSIRSIGISDNDKWLIAEIVGIGIARINMETYEAVKFSNLRTDYWYAGPQLEYAITDDGKHVAMMGMNASTEIYDITNGCGRVISPSDTGDDVRTYLANPCPRFHLAEHDGLLIERPKFSFRPTFQKDGNEITFFTTSYTTDAKWVTLRAPIYEETPQLEYLALGDSYSSGEGDTEKNSTGSKYYRLGTDNEEKSNPGVPREKCHISTRSYPYLLAQGMDLKLNSPTQWNTVACSGATVWDVKTQAQEAYSGQNDRLKGYGVAELKIQALNEFIPGRQKQIEFVKKYKPKVITLTMGGNDVGFGQKIKACMMWLTTCDGATEKGKSQLAQQIRDQYESLRSLYSELYQASGSSAKIYVLGYPQFINGDKEASCSANVGLLDNAEREMVHNSVTYFNSVIEKAAQSSGVKYIDIENSLNEHRLCDVDEKYVTGVSFLGDSENQESVHPNAKGNLEIAMSVWDNVNRENFLQYNICPYDRSSCPDLTIGPENISIPVYFQGSEPEVGTYYKKMTADTAVKKSIMNMSLGEHLLEPNTMVYIELHSDPINLGGYMTSIDGSLNTSMLIPDNTPAGYHTLILKGRSYSGEPIQYEQEILIKGSQDSDLDEDGVEDSIDACLFMKESNVDVDMDGIDDACDLEIKDSYSIRRQELFGLDEGKMNGTLPKYQIFNPSILVSETRNAIFSTPSVGIKNKTPDLVVYRQLNKGHYMLIFIIVIVGIVLILGLVRIWRKRSKVV